MESASMPRQLSQNACPVKRARTWAAAAHRK